MSEYENNDRPIGEDTIEQLDAGVRAGARHAKDAVVDAVSEGAQSMEDAVEPVYEQLVDRLQCVADDAERTLEQARSIVRSYPIASVATIAIASIALTRLLRR